MLESRTTKEVPIGRSRFFILLVNLVSRRQFWKKIVTAGDIEVNRILTSLILSMKSLIIVS